MYQADPAIPSLDPFCAEHLRYNDISGFCYFAIARRSTAHAWPIRERISRLVALANGNRQMPPQPYGAHFCPSQ
jgi:hypothetical protein